MNEQERKAYVKKLEGQLEEWNAEIDKLRAGAKKARADAQREYAEQLDELRARQEKAQKKLAELKDAGGAAWNDVRIGVEDAWNSLATALKKAGSRLG